MKNIAHLIKNLRDRGINIKLINDDLEISLSEENDWDEEFLLELKANKNNIKTYLEKTGNVEKYIQIPLAKKATEYPLSFAQRRLWVLSKFKESSIAYNMPSYIVLDGNYSAVNFEKAIAYIFNRHEILRTVFRENDLGKIYQKILPISNFKKKNTYQFFSKENLGSEEALKFIEKDSYNAFNLETGPLLRSHLFQVAEQKYIFYLNMHHIISDGWSMEILTNEILHCYNRFEEGDEIDLPSIRIQYKDFAVWEFNNQIKNIDLKSENYWKNRLSGDLQVLNLPSQKRRPEIRTFNGNVLKIKLSVELSSKIKGFCQENNSSLYIFILSSLNTLLYRYTNENDIIVGSPVSGREHPDLENQIGFYVNTIIFKNTILGTQNFEELFHQIKENTLEDYKHQNYPYDKLLDVLKLKRDLSRNPIFDIMLVVQSYSGENDDLLDEEPSFNENTIVDNGGKTSRFDLLLDVVENKNNLIINAEYNTDVYEKDMISNLLLNYISLIENLINKTRIPIAELDFLHQEEKTDLLYKFNETKAGFNNFSVLVAFEKQVKETPDKVALVFDNETISYKELSNLSNQLANHLVNIVNIDDTTNIGVMLRRSNENIISMLAIMKAGACYVPLDYNYPLKRKAYIIKDAGLKYIISEDGFFIEENKTSNIWIDINAFDLNKKDCTEVESSIQLNEKSFIVYTSGSTGNPKGVIQTSKMLSNLIEWNINHSNIDIGLNHLQYASFSFDVSVQDTFFTLCSGGTLYITNEDIRLEFSQLLDYIVSKEIGVLSFPFSVLSNLFNETSLEKLNNNKVKHIISSGEQLLVNKHLKDFLRRFPYVKLHNHYGPSETHVVTSHSMSYDQNNLENRPPIGKPISNTSIYILNDDLKLVPKTVKGEIYIGGANLAKGYINLPKETQNRFIQNPYNRNETLYKTGDLGRWLFNGNIEYNGRNDDQVKIRGYRIEIKEIENTLLEHGEIEDVIISIFTENNISFISAYIISNKEQEAFKLRDYLQRRLPHYMIPSYFIQLDKIPLTSNGKVNKKELPNPLKASLMDEESYVAPRNDLEFKMVELWQEVLKVEKIGVFSNFFDLGGNSFLAITLISKMEMKLAFKCNLKDLFTGPTVASILEVEQSKESYNFIKTEYKENYEIGSLQKTIWYEDQINNASKSYSVVWKLPFKGGSISKEVVMESLYSLMSNENLLTCVFIEKNGRIVAKKLDFKTKFKLIDWQENYEDLYSKIDIQNELPIVVYYNKGKELIIKCHHIVVDGYSVELINNHILEHIESGTTFFSDLKYQDYLFHLESEQLENKTTLFWKNYLKNKIFPIPLKIEKGKGKQFSYLELDEDLMKGIRTLASNQITLPVILSVIQLYFHKTTNQRDIILGTTFNGRNIKETKNIIGLFSSVLPIAHEFLENMTYSSYAEEYQKNYMNIWDKQYCSLGFVKSVIQDTFDINTENLINVLVSKVFADSNEINKMIDDFKEHKNSEVEFGGKFKMNFQFLESSIGSSWIVIHSNQSNLSYNYLAKMALDLKNVFTKYILNPNQLILNETKEELVDLLSEFKF